MKLYAYPFFAKRVCPWPSHVATWPPKMVVYKLNPWLHINLIHLFKMLGDFFLAAFDNFLQMILPNVKLMTGIVALFPHIFFICTCLSVAICFILISGLHAMQNFLKTIFLYCIWIPHSVNYVTHITMILLILCSKKVYVKYFAVCPRLSHLPSPLNTHGCSCEIFETTFFSSLIQASLATPNK